MKDKTIKSSYSLVNSIIRRLESNTFPPSKEGGFSATKPVLPDLASLTCYVISDADTQRLSELLALSWHCKSFEGFEAVNHIAKPIQHCRRNYNSLKELAYSKNPSQNKMQRVYVQNKDGEPLMPTERYGAVRRWLRDNKAEVVNLCPFTIRLNRDYENNKQEVIVGLDTGAVNVGCSAVSNDKVLYASETKLRTDISKKMQRRAIYRRNRRSKLRYRQPRFDNRKSKRQLPPSLQSKADSTVKIVKQLSKILPISKVIVEIAKFDTQKLQNPKIQGEEYQKGVTDYDNVRAYVLERDSYTCQICKKGEGILQTHHIKQRKDVGSDRPDNMVTVHKDCHENFHKGLTQHKFRKPKEYRMETQVTILKDFIVNELRKEFDVNVTFGYITKRNRQRLNLPKSHCFDAVAIANPKKIERIETIFKRVCVTQKRYQMTKGVRSEKKLPKGKVFGFNQWDKVKLPDKRIGFIKGRRLRGDFEICDIDNAKFEKSFKYTQLQKLCSNNVMEVQAIPPTAKAVGTFA